MINVSEDDSVPSMSYSGKFSLSDLVEQSRYFKLFEKPEELLPEFENLFKEKKVDFKKKTGAVVLILTLPLKAIQEVYLTISKEEEDPKKTIADLCQTVNDLKRQVKALSCSQISNEQLTKNLQSRNILLDEEEKNMVIDWISETLKNKEKKITMTLLYRASEHGDSSSNFHNKCNNKGKTLTLVRNTKGYRCGGFTTKNWSSSQSNINDPDAFLFSLDFKEKYPSYDGSNAIYDVNDHGPTFGSNTDLRIVNNCRQNNGNQCNFPYYYCGTRVKALSGGSYNFKVDELEVYLIEENK